MIIMVEMPDTILRRIGGCIDKKTAKLSRIQNAFFMAGYGSVKADKWIHGFFDIGVLSIVDWNPDGEPNVTCIWW